jgi:hypothetical protein
MNRTFTRDQLEEIGVPHELNESDDPNGSDDLATELHCEQTSTRRWVSVHKLIFRAPDDGKAYRVTYQQPLTEYQECDTWFSQDEITATEVEQRQVTITRWMPVEDSSTA